MKKLVLCLFLFVICYADVVYYNSDVKLINCKIISINENEYIVQTISKTGLGEMLLPKSIVKVVEYLPIDSTRFSQVIKKTKEDEKTITKINKEQREKDKQEQSILNKKVRKLKEQLQQQVEIDKQKEVESQSRYFYYKPNIPLLATGTALTTLGLVNLTSTIKLNKLVKQLEQSEIFSDEYIDEQKSNLTKAYLYGALFTIAGAIDIYYSFEKVDIRLGGNSLNMSYNF
jgi:hypothetical protein